MKSLFCIVSLLLVFSSQINAQTISPSSGHYVASVDGAAGAYSIAPANESGISYNRFSTIQTGGAGLNILNLSPDNPADIIVLESPLIELDSAIRLIGSKAEVLFLAPGASNSLSCNGCSFDGFSRITLAAAQLLSVYQADASLLGALSTELAGTVSINDLDAPSALMLDVVARNLSVSGLIDLTQRANKSSEGSVIADINGKLTVSSGSINLNVGALKWDYDSRKLLKNIAPLYPTPEDVTLTGILVAPEVKITSTKHLTVAASINNKVDILASAIYRGKVVVPSGTTTITTLSNDAPETDSSSFLLRYIPSTKMTVKGAINSSGRLVVNSAGDMLLNASKIVAGNIEANAAGHLSVFGNVEADNIKLAGAKVNNRGRLRAQGFASVWGDYYVANEFGGNITAREVIIASNNLVRNGSRTPYITDSSFVYTAISDHQPVINPSAIENGMYYVTDHSLTDKRKASSLDAFIYAEKITIRASAVENINPYWTDIVYQDDFDLTPSATVRQDIVNGVAINAGKELTISSMGYVYNSSGILRVDSPEGLMTIKGGILNNDRYRQVNLMTKSYKEEQQLLNVKNIFVPGSVNTYTSVPTKTTSIMTRSYVYSPPGRIYSAGELYVGRQFSFQFAAVINNLGYIEVGNNVKIESSSIRQRGLEHHGISNITKAEKVFNNSGAIDFGSCIGCSTNYIETGKIIESEMVLDSRELDSFFSIGGKLFAEKSAFHADNSSAFMEYVSQAINLIADDEFGFDLNTRPDVVVKDCGIAGCYNKTISWERGVEVKNLDQVEAGLSDGQLYDLNFELVETKSTKSSFGFVSEEQETVDSKALSVFDVLSEFYEKIKATILDVIEKIKNQFDWWG